MSAQPLQQALEQWASLIGERQVLAAAAAQEAYGRCTLGLTRRLAGALRPKNRSQLPILVQIAARHRVPLYPISTGHNWGYGTALPVVDDCVVVDLSGLDRIVDFDVDTGLVTLEPGVTQEKLAAFLDQAGYRYMVPVTGAGPGCSIVGNALERGYGITPHTDHFAAVMSLEAVLADGRIYRSALSALGGEDVDRAFKWGIGPYVDGLFAQGSIGIVTQMTIALAPRPQATRAFFFGLRRPEDLGPLVARVQQVVARYPGIVGGVNLMNAHRVLAMTVPYPRDRVGDDGLMPSRLVSELARGAQVMSWMGLGTLYGTAGVVAAAQQEIRALLKPCASRLVFMSARSARSIARLAGLFPRGFLAGTKARIRTLQGALELVGGRPNQTALSLAYWLSGRMPSPGAPLDPARDGCGLAWYAPLIPFKSERVETYVRMVTAIMQQHGLEPLVTLTTLSERCLDSSVPLLFEPASARSRGQAEKCYWALMEAGQREGFLPYRVGIQAMRWLTREQSTCWQVVREVKAALDPHGIIAPQRYG